MAYFYPDIEMLRRVAREELDNLYVGRVSFPRDLVSPALADVIEHPEGTVYAVVSAVNGPSGPGIYVCEMDDVDRVTRVVKRVWDRGVDAPIFYDWVNDGWLMLVSSTTSPEVALLRLDRNFNEVARADPFRIEGVVLRFYGLGPMFVGPGFPGDSNPMYILLDNPVDLGIAHTSDFSALPLPAFDWRPRVALHQSPDYAVFNGEYGRGGAIDGYATGTIISTGPGFYAFLVRVHSPPLNTCLFPAFAVHDRQAGRWVCGISYEPIVSFFQTNRFESESEPMVLSRVWKEFHLYYTRMPWFKVAWNPTYRRTEIYRLPLDKVDWRRLPVVWHVWNDESIPAGAVSPAIPGFGRKTIHFTSDTPGDLAVYIDATGRNEWKVDVTVPNTSSTIVYTDRSGLRMRLKFSVAAKVTARVVVEP